MGINTDIEGSSVYCRTPYEIRAQHSLYSQAATWIRQYAPNGSIVIDFGCNDLVGSAKLQSSHRVIGVDLCPAGLKEARNHHPYARLVYADVNNLPFSASNDVRGLMFLDILEHLTKPEAVLLLSKTRSLFPLATAVVSMPLVQPSIPLAQELYFAFDRGFVRPDTGILDRTHKILTNRSGHHQLFFEGGYSVSQELLNCKYMGVKPNSTLNNLMAVQGIYHLVPNLS